MKRLHRNHDFGRVCPSCKNMRSDDNLASGATTVDNKRWWSTEQDFLVSQLTIMNWKHTEKIKAVLEEEHENNTVVVATCQSQASPSLIIPCSIVYFTLNENIFYKMNIMLLAEELTLSIEMIDLSDLFYCFNK